MARALIATGSPPIGVPLARASRSTSRSREHTVDLDRLRSSRASARRGRGRPRRQRFAGSPTCSPRRAADRADRRHDRDRASRPSPSEVGPPARDHAASPRRTSSARRCARSSRTTSMPAIHSLELRGGRGGRGRTPIRSIAGLRRAVPARVRRRRRCDSALAHRGLVDGARRACISCRGWCRRRSTVRRSCT